MYSLKVDLTPEIYRTEGVVRALCQDRDLTGVRMLLPRGDLARDLLPAELRRAGADVTTVTAYRTVPVDLERADSPDLYQLLLKRRVDIVTFTSESSVKNLVLALGENQSVNLLKGVDIACIGPVTAAVAARLGIPATIIPSESTVSGLVSAIAEHVQAHRHEERV
jgi:uroporphyrinogen III methyltransferase/synthase